MLNDYYFVLRNGHQYGPYSPKVLQQFVKEGKVLKCDRVVAEHAPDKEFTVRDILKQCNLPAKVQGKGSLLGQVGPLVRSFVVPEELVKKSTYADNRKLLILALVGLLPLTLVSVTAVLANFSDTVVFYLISLYFSVIWGLFFYSYFKTPQVRLKTTVGLFFLTQLVIFLVFAIGLNYVNPFYWLGEANGFLLRLVFYVMAVGITEETIKAVPVWIISRKARGPLSPQTLVFYGLISGIAFGVFEGVQYQMGANREVTMQSYSLGFFMNMARLTCLPFLHAIWCGIAGYFSAFAVLYPRHRVGLYFLAIAIPALLHGCYDTMGAVMGLIPAIISVVLLMTYLKKRADLQSLLRD